MATPVNTTASAPATTAKRYPIHEQFYTWQGEGVHMGRAAYFIRTFGCPVHCPWCDSAGTWHPDHIPARVERFSAQELAQAAAQVQPDFVVITGGEPTIHDLAPLTDALHAAGLRVHLETSGAFPLRGEVDWVTLSPKREKPPLPQMLDRADEFKLIADTPDALHHWAEVLKDTLARKGGRSVWLHPEWSQRNNPQILSLITDWVKTHRYPYRTGWQLHKLYGVD